jgi:hypothetical protein
MRFNTNMGTIPLETLMVTCYDKHESSSCGDFTVFMVMDTPFNVSSHSQPQKTQKLNKRNVMYCFYFKIKSAAFGIFYGNQVNYFIL